MNALPLLSILLLLGLCSADKFITQQMTQSVCDHNIDTSHPQDFEVVVSTYVAHPNSTNQFPYYLIGLQLNTSAPDFMIYDLLSNKRFDAHDAVVQAHQYFVDICRLAQSNAFTDKIFYNSVKFSSHLRPLFITAAPSTQTTTKLTHNLGHGTLWVFELDDPTLELIGLHFR